jgi:hypothetical protein
MKPNDSNKKSPHRSPNADFSLFTDYRAKQVETCRFVGQARYPPASPLLIVNLGRLHPREQFWPHGRHAQHLPDMPG